MVRADNTATYKRDLQRIPAPLRAPLEAYGWDGILPTGSRVLISLLSGDIASAVKEYNWDYPTSRYPVAVISAFVEDHFGDLSYGHPALMLRWHDWGGRNGINDGLERK